MVACGISLKFLDSAENRVHFFPSADAAHRFEPIADPKKHPYVDDARIWEVFGVTRPSGPEPQWEPLDPPCRLNVRTCQAAESERWHGYEAAFYAYRAPFDRMPTLSRDLSRIFWKAGPNFVLDTGGS